MSTKKLCNSFEFRWSFVTETIIVFSLFCYKKEMYLAYQQDVILHILL